jgi:glycosyltransferase involved in cell wall biosynthesis
MTATDLTVIIPTLDEEALLPVVLDSLAAQQGVRLEVVVTDGGSTDRTVELAAAAALPVRVLTGPAGRGRQLNAAAAIARGEHLLFLHADAAFPDPLALRTGLDLLRQSRVPEQADRVGGRFLIDFGCDRPEFRRMAAKARLDRPGTVHGDQGLLVPRELFREFGPFDESQSMLAETRFADRLRQGGGRWLLLPARIVVSPRRFLVEGVAAREALNGIIMTAGAIGWEGLFRELPNLYRRQGLATPIDLRGVKRRVRSLLAAEPPAQRRLYWERIGRYVRDNAWQVPFRLDLWRDGDRGGGLTDRPGRLLSWYDRRATGWLERRWATVLAGWLARLWLGCR